MMKPIRLTSLLLLTSALTAPLVARAQDATDSAPATTAPQEVAEAPDDYQDADQDVPEVSVPGGEIVVTGRRQNIARDTTQVVSVLSSADIARTGEGDIAGALGRVTGLSVVGNGYVFVRGLGDRYSLALLNGSPLPSPEPLKRVVPLDLFPTNIVSSSLVQKSYSVNYPGEFGGGVINLTTSAVPRESFLSAGASIGGDTFTTGNVGYVYAGGGNDWTGFDDGTRDYAPALAAFFASGERISSGNVDTQLIGGQLINANNSLVQRNKHIGPNWSATLSGGTAIPVGDDLSLGVIATAGYSANWKTRDALQQRSLTSDLSDLEENFERVSTDYHVVVNGLLGIGAEFGDSKIRWTSLYIRDTLKNTRLGLGQRHGNDVTDYMQQDTAWYERQLFDTHLVGEFRLTPELSLDLRGGYSNSQREAPDEIYFEYVRTNVAADPYGAYFVNLLNNGNGGNATISYSDLNENLWSGGADLSWRASPGLTATLGYAYLYTNRLSSRRDFQFTAPSDFPAAVGMFRPDLLLGSAVIDYYDIALIETNEGAPAFRAKLINHAGYFQLGWQASPALLIQGGVRFETAKEVVNPEQVFNTGMGVDASTSLNNDYWLPAATITYQLNPEMQLRASASKTIARPQFRELLFQAYFDPDSNRRYQGNPLLVDSELTNAELRWEWYFDRDQRLSVAGFYKHIDKPIETYISGLDFATSFANAPAADLYGFEVEAQKYFTISDAGFFADRRAVVIANYTYTDSKLSVNSSDTVAVFGAFSTNASDYFRDGAPLTGQSDHLVNLQLGFEKLGSLSQQTLLLSYASKRVTSRGINNSGQPDVFEYPGLRLDFVARQGINLFGIESELKFTVRNILGTGYKEYQESGDNRIYYNRYDVGRAFSLGYSVKF